MTERPAQLALLLSFFLLALVGLNFVSISRTPNNSSNSIVVREKGLVLPGSTGSYHYKFYLKDASVLGAVLPGSTQDDSYLSGATVVVLNKSSFTCSNNYNFEYFDGLYKLTCEEASNLQLQISKTGYETKYVNLAYYQGTIPTIYLSKYVAPPPETIKDVTLPKVFRESKETTNLSKISNPSKVKNLTLATKKATIKFKEAVNLSSTSVRDKFKKLDQYVKLVETGVVGLNSKSLPVLNKKATVKMKGLPWLEQPRILVDGKEDPKVVSKVSYSKGELTFDVTHFSTFKAAPSVKINEPANNFTSDKKQVTLKGTVSDPTASVSAKLNNKSLGKLKVSTTSGEFTATLNLVEGVNKLVVNALSKNGATASALISGTFTMPKVNNLAIYLGLGVLALIALVAAAYSFIKMRKKAATVTTKT